jgi:hypothetical protein
LAAVDSGISSARSTATVPWSDSGTTTVPWGCTDLHPGAELIGDTDWGRRSVPQDGDEHTEATNGSWRPQEGEHVNESWGRDAVIL